MELDRTLFFLYLMCKHRPNSAAGHVFYRSGGCESDGHSLQAASHRTSPWTLKDQQCFYCMSKLYNALIQSVKHLSGCIAHRMETKPTEQATYSEYEKAINTKYYNV